jgi:hypothetical protein
MFEPWPHSGSTDTAVKRTTLKEAMCLTYCPAAMPLARQLATVLCAPDVKSALWPRIGSRDTAEKQPTLQEQRSLAY